MPAPLTHISPDTPMGANLIGNGATFRVWAPRALGVHLVSPLSEPKPKAENLLTRDPNGYWAGFWPGFQDGTPYKFHVFGPGGDGPKRDPYARELSNCPAWPNPDCLVRDPRRYPW